MFKFHLDKNFGWVLLAASAISLECYVTGFIVPMQVRKKYFTKDFMETHFGDIHRIEIGHDLPSLGYPDMGSGRYSEKLPYKAWFEFNNAQRAHYQFVENIGSVIPITLIAGLAFPKASAALGGVYFIGRLLYTRGYTSKAGANNRETGALMFNAAFIVNTVLAFATGFKWVKGGF